jgi:hypothetical protein
MSQESDELRRVADELAIRNAINRIAISADQGTVDEYASLFSEDGVWCMHPMPGAEQQFPTHSGRAGIVASLTARRAAGAVGPGTHKRHAILACAVQLDGDKAAVTTYFSFWRNLDTKPEAIVFGVYEDQFARTSEGWKLQRRDIRPA